MKTWQEHIEDLAAALIQCRDLCGNERECVRDYLADNGFSKGSVNAIVIADKARIEVARSARRSTASNGIGSQGWQRVLRPVDNQLISAGMSPLNDEQHECLLDVCRMPEALDMVSDLEMRCGVHQFEAQALVQHLVHEHAAYVRRASLPSLCAIARDWIGNDSLTVDQPISEARANLMDYIEKLTNVVLT